MVSPRTLILSAFFFVLSSGISGGAAKKKKGPPDINESATRFSKAIPPFKKSGNKQTATKQMTELIHLLADTNRNNVSSNASLIRKAFDFRDDIGAQQQIVTTGAILKAWETAYDLGALPNKRFTGRITQGRYSGERLVFEHIVPQEVLPGCAGYIGNLRLVPASQVRKPSDSLDSRDEAYAVGLKQVMYEAETRAAMLDIGKSKVGHLGLTKDEYIERWQAEVDATGNAYQEVPNLQLVGQRQSAPAKINGNTYSLRVEVTNMSRHPTEVEIISTIVGYTDENNRIYEMKRDVRTFKMRRSEVREYEIRTPNISVFKEGVAKLDPKPKPKGGAKGRSKGKGKGKKGPAKEANPVNYRGYTIVAKFKGEVIATLGSDGRMARVAAGEYARPAVILKGGKGRSGSSSGKK